MTTVTPIGQAADREPFAAPRREPGAVILARYSYPPNHLGYCGPADHQALLEYGAAREVDGGLTQLLGAFEGAFPYLRLIAEATGIGDPFDQRVAEAYWVGSDVLEHVGLRAFGANMTDRYRRKAGTWWSNVAEALPAGAVPHHSFHVFCVYPWVGRLRGSKGGIGGETALEVLDRCRVRWGQVVEASGDEISVLSRRLTWDGRRLGLGEPELERATRSKAGLGFVADLAPGDWISLHWDWVCDRLTRRQLENLRRYTLRHLQITNDLVPQPAGLTLSQTHREF